MRLHAKIAANASGAFMGRFPVLPCEIEEMCDERGALDVVKVRSALKTYDELITWSNDDDPGTIALAVELMRQLHGQTVALEKSAENDVRTQVENATDRILEKKMTKGKYASCRVDIDRHDRHLRVRIGYANPKEVVGAIDQSCRRFAVYVARVARHMAKELSDKLHVELVGLGDAYDVFAEAAFADAKCLEMDRIDEINANRIGCEKRMGEYCTPSTPDCPCYQDGKCVECQLAKKWQSWHNFKKEMGNG